MSEETTNGTSVRYSVKELLAKIDSKLDVLADEITKRATRTEMEYLARRVEALENAQAGSSALTTFVRWVVPVALTVIALALTIIALL